MVYKSWLIERVENTYRILGGVRVENTYRILVGVRVENTYRIFNY
jgi:hypothetical protein